MSIWDMGLKFLIDFTTGMANFNTMISSIHFLGYGFLDLLLPSGLVFFIGTAIFMWFAR